MSEPKVCKSGLTVAAPSASGKTRRCVSRRVKSDPAGDGSDERLVRFVQYYQSKKLPAWSKRPHSPSVVVEVAEAPSPDSERRVASTFRSVDVGSGGTVMAVMV